VPGPTATGNERYEDTTMTDAAETQSIDPVCGMTVEPEAAAARGLTFEHDGTSYAFCGKGCLLEFRDDPARYLDPSYQPSM
jgi:YHS domain-containing protein